MVCAENLVLGKCLGKSNHLIHSGILMSNGKKINVIVKTCPLCIKRPLGTEFSNYKLLSDLNFKHIPKVYGYFTDKKNEYLILEKFTHCLKKWSISEHSKKERNEVYWKMYKIVMELNELGYFHMDIKPGNFLKRGEQIVIADLESLCNNVYKITTRGTEMYYPIEGHLKIPRKVSNDAESLLYSMIAMENYNKLEWRYYPPGEMLEQKKLLKEKSLNKTLEIDNKFIKNYAETLFGSN